MRFFLYLLIFVTLLSFPTKIYAAEFFVDGTNGNNSNPGNFESPWQTIQHGIANIAPGDTLTIREGIYYVTDANRQVGIIFGPAGTDLDNKTTIRAAYNERVLITRTDGYPPQIGLRDFVRIERLWMGGRWDIGETEMGGGFHPGGSPIGRGKEIIDSTIFGYRTGINIGSSEHLLIQGNRLIHTGYLDHSHGIYLSGGYTNPSKSQHIILDNNLFLKGQGYGIHAYHNAKTMIITRNFVAYHNYPGTISQGNTTTLNPPQSDFLVANNFFWKSNKGNTFGLNAVKNVQYHNNFHGPGIGTGGGYELKRIDKDVIQKQNVYTDTLQGEHGDTDFAIPLSSLKSEIGLSESEIDTTINQIDVIFNGTTEEIFNNGEIEDLFHKLQYLKPGNSLRHKGFNWFGAALTPHALSNTLVPEGQRDFWQAFDDLGLLHYDEYYQPITSETELYPHIYETIPKTDYQYYHYLQDPPDYINQFHVTTNGSASNDGSQTNPWDLTTALNGGTASLKVQPGDIIWIHGGLYTGNFESKLNGQKNRHIFVAPYQNEQVTLDGIFNSTSGYSWVIFWDLIFRGVNSSSSHVNFASHHSKIINSVVKDMSGVGLATQEGNTNNGTNIEVYGTLLTQNSSHGIYCQNGDGYKTIQHNLMLVNGYYNLHCYGQTAHMRGFIILENAMIGNNNNSVYALGNQDPVQRLYFVGNHFGSPGSAGVNIGSATNKSAYIIDNYIGIKNGGQSDLSLSGTWEYLNVQRNTFYTSASGRPAFLELAKSDYTNFDWDNNLYADTNGAKIFRYEYYLKGERMLPILTLPQIQSEIQPDRNGNPLPKAFGFDLNGSYIGKPTQNQVFVYKNKYKPKRAHVIVRNWEETDTISVDLSEAGFVVGDAITIYNAFNYFDDTIHVTYSGDPIEISMLDRTLADTPNSANSKTQYNPFPHTGVFIIEATATQQTILGDVNQDNLINILDLLTLITHIFTSSNLVTDDINQDDIVDLVDVFTLIPLI